LNTLTTLTWNHFLRSFCGRPEDMTEAEGFARRLAELADDLGARDQAVHGWSLLTVMARLSGRFDEATVHALALQRAMGSASRRDPWLGWAASFSVTVAGGARDAAPPFPPSDSPDPIVRMAKMLIEAELTMAGRVQEALDRVGSGRPDLGPIGDLAQVFQALALILAGRKDEARPWVERAATAAALLNAPTSMAAASALRAEIIGNPAGLPPKPETARGVTDILVLRAFASLGDVSAIDALRAAAEALAMPGLMIRA
jgi:hypothetical protein